MITFEKIKVVSNALRNLPDRIQGFSTPLNKNRTEWGAPHYILDVYLPDGRQELWRGDDHNEMLRRCDAERLRLAFEMAGLVVDGPKMVRYRPHRGGLGEAMAEMVKLASKADLIAHLKKWHAEMYGAPEINEDTLHIKPYGSGPDTRIGWEQTFIVMLDGWGPVGFSDGDFSESNQ